MNELKKRMKEFLHANGIACNIEFGGIGLHPAWEETQKRAFYNVNLKSQKGSYIYTFWDSIRNTELLQMTPDDYIRKTRKCQPEILTYGEQVKIRNEFAKKQSQAKKPSEYNVITCLQFFDPGLFHDYCNEYGYDPDSRRVLDLYLAVQREYAGVCRVFTESQRETIATEFC